MESLLEKLSSYNILNNLIPGAFFAFFWNQLDLYKIELSGVVESLFVYYLLGMIISRIGSLVVEELFKKWKLIKYTDKHRYIEAVNKDSRIADLLETSNMYRTCAALFLTLSVAKGYALLAIQFSIPKWITVIMVALILLVLFSTSFIKQTRHIVSRVDIATGLIKGE